MGELLFILFCLFVVFIVVPIGRTIYEVYRARKRFREMFNNFAGANGNRSESSYNDRSQHTRGWNPFSGRQRQNDDYPERKHRRRRKKIDPNIGEYVDFEEIQVYQSSRSDNSSDSSASFSSTSYSYSRAYSEAQIEDAEWEDI